MAKKLKQDSEGRYYTGKLRKKRFMFTVYCAEHDNEDTAVEEIDVLTKYDNPGHAMAVAELAISQDYEDIIPMEAVLQQGTFFI